jgi:hypothetical protein
MLPDLLDVRPEDLFEVLPLLRLDLPEGEGIPA